MGLFSDTCRALIDPQTRRVLTGQRLEQARRDPKWPRCGTSVKKTARVCSSCGSPAPGGWAKCPACGKWVGNESNFCWNCNTPLHPETRVNLAGGVWQRSPGVFAERFEVGDVKPLLEKGLHVQEGTGAILLDSGRVAGVLSAGRHNPTSLARFVNWFGHPPPRSLILIESGDVVLRLCIEALRSAEKLPLELHTEVTLRFVERSAQDFVANLFKDARGLDYTALAGAMQGAIRTAAENICNTTPAEDLIHDPERRLRVEDALQDALKDVLASWGLELVRVASAEFTGKEYEELLARAGQIEVKRRGLEFDQRLRELLSQDKMGQFKTEHDLEEYVAQLAQEKGVSDVKRDHELARLRQVQRHELAGAEAAHEMQVEMDRTRHELAVAWEREQGAIRVRVEKAKAEIWETEQALELRGKKNREKERHLSEFAHIIGGKSLEELVLLTDDADKRRDLLQLCEMKLRKDMTPEQMMAFMADKNPAIAHALAAQAGVNKEEMRRLLDEYKAMNKEAFDRAERTYAQSMGPALKAAERPLPGTQVIK